MRITEKHIKKAMTVYSAASTALGVYKSGREFYENRFKYTVTIDGGDAVYKPLLHWLNKQQTGKAMSTLTSQGKVLLLHTAEKASRFEVNGHSYTVYSEKPAAVGRSGDSLDYESSIPSFAAKLVIVCQSKPGVDNLREFLETVLYDWKSITRKPGLYTYENRYWNSLSSMPDRPFESVFLPTGVKEAFEKDITTFLDSERQYAKIGMPWHRGYLLYGPPGNGKSTLSLATANHLGLNLFSLPLSNIKDDSSLSAAINNIEPRSVVLLEDIDIFSKSISREQSPDGPTLAGLLNALDGVATPHGLVVIMTTNYANNLDPALIRPGRVDMKIHFDKPNADQITRAFEYCYDEPLAVEPKEFENMATVSNIFKSNLRDPEAARLEIKA